MIPQIAYIVAYPIWIRTERSILLCLNLNQTSSTFTSYFAFARVMNTNSQIVSVSDIAYDKNKLEQKCQELVRCYEEFVEKTYLIDTVLDRRWSWVRPWWVCWEGFWIRRRFVSSSSSEEEERRRCRMGDWSWHTKTRASCPDGSKRKRWPCHSYHQNRSDVHVSWNTFNSILPAALVKPSYTEWIPRSPRRSTRALHDTRQMIPD